MLTINLSNPNPAILTIQGERHWTWEDYFERLTVYRLLLVMGYERFDVIIDVGETAPMGLIHHVQKYATAQADSLQAWGITVIVGGGSYAEIAVGLLGLADELLASRYFSAASCDKAHAIIRTHRILSSRLIA